MNPADTNVSPVIHVAALELQNFLVICERGAKPWKTGPRYEWWDSSHVIQPFGSEVTDTLCTLRHLHVDTLILGVLTCNVISSLPLMPSWLWREAGTAGG